MMHRRAPNLAAILLFAAICGIALSGLAHDALAQGNPFGGPRPPAAAPAASHGVVAWLLTKQAEFYRALSALMRAAKADGSAVWTLLGVSFLYGVFHAVGPGHGKAVISSYLVANDETWRRGIVLSFASALMQALVAVLLVGIAAVLLGATAATMNSAVRWIEVISYALIVVVGLRLLWTKGRAFLAALRAKNAAVQDAPQLAHAHAHSHSHHHHAHAHGAHAHDVHSHPAHDHAADDHVACSHAHHNDAVAPAQIHAHGHDHGQPGHVHDEHCGHFHGPGPEELAGPGGWQRGLTAIFAVGLRPCSGAILVLVFALAQGLFWAGVAATFAMGFGTALAVSGIATLAVGAKGLAAWLARGREGGGTLALRGVEVAAALVVVAFGTLLLTGYLASERLLAG